MRRGHEEGHEGEGRVILTRLGETHGQWPSLCSFSSPFVQTRIMRAIQALRGGSSSSSAAAAAAAAASSTAAEASSSAEPATSLLNGSPGSPLVPGSPAAERDGSSVSARRAVWNQHPAARPQAQPMQPVGSPLDLVAQLRGDFEAYTREVYSRERFDPDLDELRARRHHERQQLDSLHARLHGLRLILAMAQLNVAANSEFERGERVELFSEPSPDDPSVMLVSLGRNAAPPEPQGVPEKRLEELLPKSTVGKEEEGNCCSICICDFEVSRLSPSGQRVTRVSVSTPRHHTSP